MTLHFLNDVVNDTESTPKIENNVIIASLKRELKGKLKKSIPGSAMRTHVESLGKPRDVNKRSQRLAW